QATRPNALWAIDFKGDFSVGRTRCYPLTVTDAYSRYIIACVALTSTRTGPTRRALEKIFDEFGLPDAIRTDNGSPFSAKGLAGLSKLSVWWHKLGIRHERIEPGHPEQNGRHERMHRTLKQETIRPPAPTLRAQQLRFNAFQREYNEERPPEALANATPWSRYRPSSRAYPHRLRAVQYPDHFKTRKVAASGRIRWSSEMITIGHALEGEWIGIEPGNG